MDRVDKQFISTKQILWLLLISVCILTGIASIYINPMIIVAAIILVLNIVVMMKYPMWGLLAYLIIFLLRPGEMYPALAAFRVELVTGIFVLVAVIIRQKLVEGTVSFPRDRITLSLIAFLAVMCISIFSSYEKSLTIDECIGFIKLLIFYYLIVSVIDNKRKFVAFMTVFLFLIAYIAFDAFKSYISGGFITRMGVDRMYGSTSAGGDPNALAATLGATIPLVIASAFYFRHLLVKISLWLLALGMAYLITITASRSGLLAFIGVLFGGFIYARHKVILFAAAVLLIAGVWSAMPGQYRQRYMTLSDMEDINQTSSGRIEIWEAGIKMIAARPILGVGAGAFSTAAGSGNFGYSSYMEAHNLYIQLMATTGIIGFVVWFAFIYFLIKNLRIIIRAVRERAEELWVSTYCEAFIVSMIALFVSGLFGHNLYRYTWYMMAGLVVALVNIYKDRLSLKGIS
ncbi:MAG: O-antigen ligase family protein [Candidatus Zixiibacteriota bacterium]